jgi:hypothetical protein
MGWVCRRFEEQGKRTEFWSGNVIESCFVEDLAQT